MKISKQLAQYVEAALITIITVLFAVLTYNLIVPTTWRFLSGETINFIRPYFPVIGFVVGVVFAKCLVDVEGGSER